MISRQSHQTRYAAIFFAAGVMALSVSSFQPAPPPRRHGSVAPSSVKLRTQSSLEMAGGGGVQNEDGGGSVSKQRRRKRKKSADGDVLAPAAASSVVSGGREEDDDETAKKKSAKVMVQELLAREQMMLDDSDLTSFIPQKLEDDARIAAAARKAGYSVGSGDVGVGGVESQLEDLFDSREFLQRKREKQMEEIAAASGGGGGGSSSAVPTRKKIKRSDVEAFNKLLEMDPIADEDDSYFEDRGIDFISALLGDVEPGVGTDSDESSNKTGKKVQKKTSFLGIGSGPLQVGHFIGALGVVLMAFVEYPGFPLTNLPDPLRGSLQGGKILYLPIFLCRAERDPRLIVSPSPLISPSLVTSYYFQ